MAKEARGAKDDKFSGKSYAEDVKAEAAEENEQKEDPKAEGWAIYDHAASLLGHVFYTPAGATEEQARQAFLRAHRHSGEQTPRLSLVTFKEVSTSKDVREHPDKWEFDDVPEVDRRT
jgi:hypothetical protein